MKKILIAFVATVISLGANAQTDTSQKKMSPPDFNDNIDGNLNRSKTNDGMNKSADEKDIQNSNGNINNMRSNPDKALIAPIHGQTNSDGVMMTDGKMMVMKNGQTTRMSREMTMANGVKIMSNGTIIQKDGSRRRLKEGQHMDMVGMITPVNDSEMKKDDDSKKLKQY